MEVCRVDIFLTPSSLHWRGIPNCDFSQSQEQYLSLCNNAMYFPQSNQEPLRVKEVHGLHLFHTDSNDI